MDRGRRPLSCAAAMLQAESLQERSRHAPRFEQPNTDSCPSLFALWEQLIRAKRAFVWAFSTSAVATLLAPRALCGLHDTFSRWTGVAMTRMAELACEIELEEAHKTIKLRQLPGKARLRLDGPADPALPRRRNEAQYLRPLRARGVRCLLDTPYRRGFNPPIGDTRLKIGDKGGRRGLQALLGLPAGHVRGGKI